MLLEKKITLKSIRGTCHMTGAESRGSLGRPGLHPARPEFCCAPGSAPCPIRAPCWLRHHRGSGGCLLSPVLLHPNALFMFPVLPQHSWLGSREEGLLEFRSSISTSFCHFQLNLPRVYFMGATTSLHSLSHSPLTIPCAQRSASHPAAPC